MSIVSKTLNVLTNRCKKGWRYGEWNCFVNTKIILSIFFSFNLFSAAVLLYGKKWTLKYILFFDKQDSSLLMMIIPFIFFILLTILYPKKKILAIKLTIAQEKEIVIQFIIYCILTMILALII
jgi:hypothetical protein